MSAAPMPGWLFVFSHPNHEIAVYGQLQRLRPQLLFLTDGGGPRRVAETRDGLQRVGLLASATFLDRPEQALYDALLARDVDFYRALAVEVAAVITRQRPGTIAADAVEFYNPVHDMALPVTLAARQLAGSAAALHEVPLIFQRREQDDFAVQTPLGTPVSPVTLSASEWQAKWRAWTEVYGELRAQLGPVIAALPHDHLRSEALQQARDPLRQPLPAERLRYEERGRRLAAEGAIDEVITLAGHVQPVTRALLGACGEA